jgi:hypothetical protein
MEWLKAKVLSSSPSTTKKSQFCSNRGKSSLLQLALRSSTGTENGETLLPCPNKGTKYVLFSGIKYHPELRYKQPVKRP